MVKNLEIIARKDSKKTRLGIHWKGQWINFCTVEFLKDGSFVFSSKFHNSAQSIDIGSAKQTKEGFVLHTENSNQYTIENGFHITLHPRGQVMQFRKNFGGPILRKREINWFPVNTPFNLLHLYSPPLDICETESRKPDFIAPFPDEYTNSISMTIDIFPRNTEEHINYTSSIWVFWGWCPNYLVRVSFNKLNERTSALLLWPNDSNLIL